MVAWLLLLGLPLQGLATSYERVAGPAHVHVAVATLGTAAAWQHEWSRGWQSLGRRIGASIEPLLPAERGPLMLALERAMEHERMHALGIAHRHEAGEPGVVYAADPVAPDASGSSTSSKRVVLDVETTLLDAVPVPTGVRFSGAPSIERAESFTSRGTEPLERPPR